MNRRTQKLGALAIVAVLVLAGCTNNLFSSFDDPDPGPNVNDLRTTYQNSSDPVVIMDAASQAGTQTVVANDDALQTVNNFANVITTLSNSENQTPDTEQIIADLFPDNMSDAEAGAMIDAFLAAADDFTAFANATASLGTAEDPLTSGEKGDTVQMALISLAVKEVIDADANNRQALIDLATGTPPENVTFSGSVDTFENLNSTDGSPLANLISYAGLGDTF